MNKLLLKGQSLAGFFFRIVVSFYFLVSIVYFFFFIKKGDGDESLFINDLTFVQDHGWIAAIAKNISIPYTCVYSRMM
jgi:hypothetical protein